MNKQTEALIRIERRLRAGVSDEWGTIALADIAKEALEQEAQEPVAWTTKFDTTNIWESPESPGEPFIVPLYTHPAPSWQGLSDDERHEVIVKHVAVDCTCDPYEFARAIEQALKERNS